MSVRATRIGGLDLARALAILAMVAVNFELVLSNQLGPQWLERALAAPRGRASALFVVLAGVGMTLLAGDDERGGRGVLMRRGVFLLAVGYPFCLVWQADILHFYGFYFFLGAIALRWPGPVLLALAVACMLATPVLLVAGFDYERGWALDRLEYADLWTWEGQLRHLFFNGFHPILPWMAFVLWGLWLGRRLRADPASCVRMAWPALAVAVVVELGSAFAVRALGGFEAGDGEAYLVATVSMPPNPLYVVAAAATATAVIGGSIWAVERYGEGLVVRALMDAGQLALTIYALHIVLGIGVFDTLHQLGSLSLAQVAAWWLSFCYVAVVGSHLWRKRFARGPLEAVMRALTRGRRKTAAPGA